MQVQNAVVNVEVVGQQEIKCGSRVIFLGAVLVWALLVLPCPSC